MAENRAGGRVGEHGDCLSCNSAAPDVCISMTIGIREEKEVSDG